MAEQPAQSEAAEARRVARVLALDVLDTPSEERFDRLTRLASRAFDTPVALISFIDETRQWCKSKVGIAQAAIPRPVSICAETIRHRRVSVVADLWASPRFADNPLLSGDAGLRCYAGAPLVIDDLAVGTLCVMGTEPRAFSADDELLLQDLAHLVEQELSSDSLRSAHAGLPELRQILDDVDLAVITVHPNGRIENLNQVGLRMFGYRAAEIVGCNLNTLLPLRAVVDKATAGGFHESVGRRQNGGLFSLEFSTSRSPAGASGVHLYFIRDISEHKRDAEALRLAHDEAVQALQAKARFLATMSHEIRTPMNGVIGMTGLLLDSQMTEEQRDWTQTIRISGEQLLSVINDILDYSKIESNKLDLETQPFELVQCLEDATSLVAVQAAAKSLELISQIEPDVPLFLRGDVTRLRQVLVNLLGNAVKFTERGYIAVTARMPEGSALIEFEVRDSGIGISADDAAKLFQPFTQADSSTSRRYGGSGLGLAICRHLAGLMGGDIQVESMLGQGSTFRFTIAATIAPAPLEIPAYLETDIPAFATRRALLVDDSEIFLTALGARLAQWGLYTETTTSPEEALTLAANGEFDVVLIDLQMPARPGRPLYDDICAFAPSLKAIGLSTSYVPRERRGELVAVLMKPLRQGRLFDALLRVLAASETASKEVPSAPAVSRPPTPLTILVAEDNAVNQKLVIEMLRRLGYRADHAATGVEAVEAVARRSYDLILMDMQMPEMDGVTATRKIISYLMTSTTMARPYIVALTANASRADHDLCLEAGMDHYITKPMKFEVLRALIDAVVKKMPLPEQPAEPEVADKSVIDIARIAELMAMFNGSIKRLSSVFERSGAENLVRLRACAESADASGIAACAHSLKGMSLNIGASKFATLCAAIEAKARREDLSGIMDLITEAAPLFNATCQELTRVESTGSAS